MLLFRRAPPTQHARGSLTPSPFLCASGHKVGWLWPSPDMQMRASPGLVMQHPCSKRCFPAEHVCVPKSLLPEVTLNACAQPSRREIPDTAVTVMWAHVWLGKGCLVYQDLQEARALITGSSLLRVDFLVRLNRGKYSESEFSLSFLQPGKQIYFNAKLATLHNYSEDRFGQ